jgi:hypothetical protein
MAFDVFDFTLTPNYFVAVSLQESIIPSAPEKASSVTLSSSIGT